MIRWLMGAAIVAACLSMEMAQAQTNRQPWQGTFVKTTHAIDGGRMVVDLPLPAAGKLLTLERISVTMGQPQSIYGKLLSCEVESTHPRVQKSEFATDRVKTLLPLPVVVLQPTKTFEIFNTPVLVYADSNVDGVLRVVCATEFTSTTERLTVTVAGYTSDK
jgi:hypothetical protein